VGDLDAILARVARLVPLDETDIVRIKRDVSRRPVFMTTTIKENLSWDQVSKVELQSPDLPGVSIEVGELRQYPYGVATAHTVGYIARVSINEINEAPLLSLPDIRVGKTGVERRYEAQLRGLAGQARHEVNALGRVIRELDRQPGQNGRDIQLSLDIGLQQFVQQRLAAERSASAVVIDVETGELMALCSHPSYDPNQFTRGISQSNWNALIGDETAPLTNKAIAGQYAPGSTFKMIVALAALDAGVIGPDHRVYCPGYMKLGNHRFHCWKRSGHGWLDLHRSVMQSCDVYYYDIAKRVGIDRIAAMAQRFGLGSVLDVELPGERHGIVPNRQWKLARHGTAWMQGETINASIGQGYVLSTPLQLAVMTARLASGRAVMPRITKVVPAQGSAAAQSMGLSAQHLAVVQRAMEAVTAHRRGTAYQARITDEGMFMAGKTGTSQVRRITLAERTAGIWRNEDLPWRRRDHALFVGYAPRDKPRYACSVVVEHGGSGGSIAAPIARDILLDCQRRDPARTGSI
jgi:penicillin-binding protein 2